MVWMLGSAVAKESVNGGEAHVSGCGEGHLMPLLYKLAGSAPASSPDHVRRVSDRRAPQSPELLHPESRGYPLHVPAGSRSIIPVEADQRLFSP